VLELARRDGSDCGICGEVVDLAATGDLGPSVDHIIPRAKGGSNDPSNLQLAHMRCNRLKSDRLIPVAEGVMQR
jgi:5-methylcytosine-specific restriction endonuclease McrA